MGEVPDHRSVSQLTTFTRCGEMYRLERVESVPPRPAAWLAQGTAFHKAIEEWERSLRQMPADRVRAIYCEEYTRLIGEGLDAEPNLDRWLTGGRTKASDDIDRRRQRGLEQVNGYLSWAASSGDRVWLMYGDTPAVEVEFSLDLDGIQVVGFIDQIKEWSTGQVGPSDLKTGSKRPDWPIQLGVYALAIEEMFGFRPAWGDFYIAKMGRPDPPVDLTGFTRERVTAWFHMLDRAIREGLFLPNPGDSCRTCGVSEYCEATRAVAGVQLGVSGV